ANVILLNKTDLVTSEQLDELEYRIRGMNALVKIYRTQNCDLDLDSVLGVQAFNLESALEIDPEFLEEEAHKHDEHDHDESVYSVAIVEPQPLDFDKLNAWMTNLLQTQGPDIFRMKGILNIAGESERFVFQGVHMIFDGKPDRPWKSDETPKNELVFIGRNLDEAQLKQEFLECLA
ncbi:MAG: GTP-binding protein, partial [Cyanobacteria bacterium P01_H01_bin.15]